MLRADRLDRQLHVCLASARRPSDVTGLTSQVISQSLLATRAAASAAALSTLLRLHAAILSGFSVTARTARLGARLRCLDHNESVLGDRKQTADRCSRQLSAAASQHVHVVHE